MTDAMTERVKAIANAVLYEGYLLYPYRHSAIKNRQRWTYGVVYPCDYSAARGGADPWTMRTECLVEGDEHTTLDVTVRFLHLLACRAADAVSGSAAREPWEEAVERDVPAPALPLGELVARPRRFAIASPADRIVERPDDAQVEIVREHAPLAGSVTVAAERVAAADGRLFKVSAEIANTSPAAGAGAGAGAGATPGGRGGGVPLQSFVSTHTILGVHGGAFVSLMDPPDALRDAAHTCRNERTWPVLAGDEGERDAMLSSPIILYDYPRIAPESVGALFDGTEIDEILTLRILTLTDEEKDEMRQGDARTREILERSEALTAEQLMNLHGTIRSLRPVGEGGGGA